MKSTESFSSSNINGGNMHKEFSSTPDLKKNIYSSSSNANLHNEANAQQFHMSNENMFHVSQLNARNIENNSNPKNIVNGDMISDHLTDTKHILNGMDSRVGHQRGYYTLPSRHKKVFEEGGSYRAAKRIRPVIKGKPDIKDDTVKQNETLSPTVAPPAPPPPPEHPPPPPPITQVMALDTKSDYAKVFNSSTSNDQSSQQPSTSVPTEGLKQALNEESIVSPGGSVRSSFKPSDNAKLYASPQNVQQLAYRSPVTTNRAVFENLSSMESKPRTSPIKKRSPTARANSMPPRPSRPQVLRRSSTTEMPLKSPLNPSSANTSTSNAETYNINGVNYTTYTTFRSPITPEECDVPGSLSSRTFAGVDPDLTPTALDPERFSINGAHPVIPEPDYDMSDSDYGGSSSNGNNYYCGSDIYSNGFRSSNGTGSNGTTLERKKKKTVSFVINEEVAAKLQAGRTTRQDSILKDPSREREREKERVEMERLEREREELFSTSKHKRQNNGKQVTNEQPSPFALGERYAEPIVKIPMAKLKTTEINGMVGNLNPSQASQQNYQLYGINIGHEEAPKTVVRVAEADKIRIEVPPVVPVKSVLSRSNSAAGNAATNGAQRNQSLQKSRSFCAEKSMLSVSGENTASNSKISSGIKLNNNTNNNNVSASNAGTVINDISANEILRVRSQLKSSRSFSNEFPKKATASPNRNIKSSVNESLGTDMSHEEAENSSSGVSSDQEQNVTTTTSHGSSTTAAKFVTYLPVDGGSASTLEVTKGMANTKIYNSTNSGVPGRSLGEPNTILSLQPTHQSVIDNVSESGSDDVSSEKSWVLRAEQDNLGRNIVYMKKMLHPKLQAIFDKPSNGVGPGSSSSSTNSSSPTPPAGVQLNTTNPNNHPVATSSQREHDSLMSSSMSSNASSSLSHSSHRDSNPKISSSSVGPTNYGYSSQTLPHRHQYPNYLVQQQYSQQNRQSSNNSRSSSNLNKPGNDERSISQSLALINQHVNSLGEVNVLAGINNKDSSEVVNAETSGAVLAPPPGFSDAESHQTGSHSSLRSMNPPGKKVTFVRKASEHVSESYKDSKASDASKNHLMTRSMGPTYSDGFGKTQNTNVMSQSIMDFNTTNHSRHDQCSFIGGKGMKNDQTKTSSASLSYATLPKKHHLNAGNQKQQSQFSYSSQSSNQQPQKEFRTKPLIGWSIMDVCDWLDSLFMPEYKPAFLQNEVDGFKLASITKSELESLGVIRVGHMLNIEKSLKRYLTA